MMLGSAECRERKPTLISHEIIFQVFQLFLCDHDISMLQTDGYEFWSNYFHWSHWLSVPSFIV